MGCEFTKSMTAILLSAAAFASERRLFYPDAVHIRSERQLPPGLANRWVELQLARARKAA
jgi:hypothetical protein